MLDLRRQRIVLNEYSSTGQKWTTTKRCDPKGGVPADGHMTACVAMDIDRDGDLDLIVGGYAEWRTAEPQSGPTSYALAKLKHESTVMAEETARVVRASWLETREMTETQRHEHARKLFLQNPNKLMKQAAARQQMLQRIQRLLPVEHKEPFVWLYENVSKQPRK